VGTFGHSGLGQAAPGRLNQPFVGIPSFLRAPICGDLGLLEAEIAVVGVPTDEGSPFMPGSRFAPRAIREHSLRFVTGEGGYYDPQRGRRFLEREMNESMADVGDVDILPTNVAGTFENVTATTRAILEAGAMPVILGGDHAITFPVVRAFGGPLYVVHFDAHLDYMPFVHGIEFSNQHAFRHIRRMAHVADIVQVGIRSIRNTEEMHRDAVSDGNRVVTMEAFRDLRAGSVLDAIPAGASCYVSVDIDVLDLSLVPGCVSAEPDGMGYAELRDTLQAIAEHTDVVGFDLVEVNPQLDVATGVTSYLAAHLVVEFLGQICDQPRWHDRREERAERRARLEATPEVPSHPGSASEGSKASRRGSRG
jgi:agmatinase